VVAQYQPTDDELCLWAILNDPSGIDLAEFAFVDEDKPDKIFRCWDFQWGWYRTEEMYQIEQASRTLGKSMGVAMRACTHPFIYPGQERLITGPELNHVRPLVDAIEKRLDEVWFIREMRPKGRFGGISRTPHWQCTFLNGAEIRSRLPGKFGTGVKGQHPVVIELDEGQDFPELGWSEVIHCLKEVKGAQFRVHGVPKGARDRFWRYTTGLDPNLPWFVHRILAMYRPTWSADERRRQISLNGGSRASPDYRRNIYGEHGDQMSPLFVLARLMACVDQELEDEYNSEIYANVHITHEDLEDLRAGYEVDDVSRPGVEMLLETAIPTSHQLGWAGFTGGGDVGLTNHPSEFLIFGHPKVGKAKDVLQLLTRIHMERVRIEDQQQVLLWLKDFYSHGGNSFRFGVDRAGLGQGLYQPLSTQTIEEGVNINHAKTPSWLIGWDFGEKVVVALDEDIPVNGPDGIEDQFVYRNFLDFSSEELRRQVDAKRILMPNDSDLINQWQGQTWVTQRGADIDPNRPKRKYAPGTFHTLDAAKYMIATKALLPLHDIIQVARTKKREPVFAIFPGASPSY
jgi:hypothetical protein